MADKKISALTASTTPLAGTEVLPIVQAGSTVKVSIADVTAGRAVSVSSLTASTGSFIVSTSGQGITTGSSIPLGLGTNNTLTAVTIDTSSNLLVGTTVADNKLTVSASSSGVATGVLSLVNPNDATSTAADLDFVCHSSGTLATGRIRGLIAGADNYPMSFWTYGGGGIAERMRITATGDVSVATGNIVIGTAGKGIDFSAATHAAGMTSELLNDYEEGTWTPSVGGDTTYFTQNGTYTKVGRLVFVQGLLYINVQGTGSATTISGLPFTPGADSTATMTYFSGLATNVVSINGRIASGASSIVLYGLTAAGAAAQTAITTFQNQTYIQFSAVYSV